MEDWSCSSAGYKSGLVQQNQQNPAGSAQMIPDEEADGGESFCKQEVDSQYEAERREPRLSGEEQSFGSVLHQMLQQQKHKPGRRFKKKTLVRMAKLLVIAKGWDGGENKPKGCGEDEPKGRQTTGNRKTSADLSTEPTEDPGPNTTGSVFIDEGTKIIKPASSGATKTAKISLYQTTTIVPGFTVKEEPWTSLDGPEPGPGLSLQPVVQHKPQQNFKRPTKKRPDKNRTKTAENRTKPASRRRSRATKTAEISLYQTTTTVPGFTVKEEPWTSLDGPGPGLSFHAVVQPKPQQNVKRPTKKRPAKNRTKTAENRTNPEENITKQAENRPKPASRRGRRAIKTAVVSLDQTSATTVPGFTVKEEPWTSLDGPGLSLQPVVQHKPRQIVKKLKKRLPVSLQEPTNQNDASLFQQEPQTPDENTTKPAENTTKPTKNTTKPAKNRTKQASRRGRRATKTAKASLDQTLATTGLGFTVKEEPWTSLDGPGPGLSLHPVVQHKPQQNVTKLKKKRLHSSLQEPTNQKDASLFQQEPQTPAENTTKPTKNTTKPASIRERRPTKTGKVSLDQTLATTGLGFTVKEEPWTSLDGPELSLQPVVQHKPQQNVKRPNKKRPAENTTKPAKNRTKPAENTTEPAENTTKPVENRTKPAENTTKPVENGTKPAKNRPKPASRQGRRATKTAEASLDQNSATTGLGFTVKEEPSTSLDEPGPGLSLHPVVQHKPQQNVTKLKKRLLVSLEEPTNQDKASLFQQEPQKTAENRTKPAEDRPKPASRRGRRPTKTAVVSLDQTLATTGLGFTVKEEPWTSLDGPGPGLSLQPVVQHKPQQNVTKLKKRLLVSLEEPTNQDKASLFQQEPQKTAENRTKPAKDRPKPASRRGRRPTKTAVVSLDQTLATTGLGFTVKEEPWTSLDGPGPGLFLQPVVQHKPQQNVTKLKKKRLHSSLQEPTNQKDASLFQQEPQTPAENTTKPTKNTTKPASIRERRPTKTGKVSLDQTLATTGLRFTVKAEPWTSLDGPELPLQPVVQHKPQQNVKRPNKKRPAENTTKPAKNTTKPAKNRTKPAENTTKPVENGTKPASRRGRRPTKTAENQTKPGVRENLKKNPAHENQSSKISQLKENIRRGATSLEQKEPTVESVKPRGPGRPRKTVLIKTEPVWDFEMNHLDFPSTDPKTPLPQKKKLQKQNLKLNSLYDTMKPVQVKEEPNSVPVELYEFKTAELYCSDETAEVLVKKTRQRNVKRVKDDPTQPEERLKRYLNHSGDKNMSKKAKTISDKSREEAQPMEAENTTTFNKMKKPSAARGGANRTVKAAPGNVSGNRKRKCPPSEFNEAFPNSASTQQEDVMERRRKRAKREPKKAVCTASAGPETGPTLDQMKPEQTPDLKETVSLDVNSKTSTSCVEKCRKRKRTLKKTLKGLELQVCPDWTRGDDATEDDRLSQTSKVKQRRDAFTIKMEETSFPVTDLNIVQKKPNEVLSMAPTKTRAKKRRGRTKTHQRDKKEISSLEVISPNSSFFNQNLKIQPKTQIDLRERRRPLQCPFCLRSFRHISAFNLHKRIHTGDKPYGCSVCTKRFSGRSQLLRHAKVHEGPAAVRCPCCDGAFGSKPDLIRHFKVHLSEAEGSQKEPEQNPRMDSGSSSGEAFRCSVCSKEFRKKSTFKMHQRRHARRKFSRSVQEATSASRCESAVVITPTVFKCSICKRLHRRWCHYVLHLQSHVSGTSPRCDACGQSYDQPPDIPRHCSVCCRKSGEETACRGYLKNICKERKDEERASSRETETLIVPSMRDSAPQTSNSLDLDPPTNDHLNLNIQKRDHLDLSTQTTDNLDLDAPTNNHLNLDASMNNHLAQTKNHLDLNAQTKDHLDLNAQTKDHLDRNAQTTDPLDTPTNDNLDLNTPKSDHLDLNAQTKDHLDLDTKTKAHLDLYAPTNNDSDLEAPTNDDLNLEAPSPSSAFRPMSRQTSPRLSGLRLPRLGGRFLCGRTFPWNKLWLHHQRGGGAFRCNRCKLEFHFLGLYVRHLQEHTAQTTHTCPTDDFTDKEDLKTHLSVYNKRSDRLNCRTCGKCFSVRRNLKEHELLHKGRRPYACRPCRRSFSCPASLAAHLRIHRKRLSVPQPARVDEPFLFPYRCRKCPGRFSSADLLQAHQVCHFVAGKKPETSPETLVSFLSKVQRVPSDPLPKKLPVSNKKHLFRYPHPDRLYVIPVISSEPPIVVSDTEEETRPESPEESLQLQVLIQSLIPEKCQSDDEGSHDGEGRDNDDEGSHDGDGRDDGAAAKYSNCELCSLIFKDVMSLHQHYREHAQGMRSFC